MVREEQLSRQCRYHIHAIRMGVVVHGTSYTVAETPAGGYTTTSENASGTLEADTEAVFTNRRNMAIPTNAASGGMLPWIFTVAGAAGLLFALQKKKSR